MTPRCPRCHADLLPHAPEGLCPACLLDDAASPLTDSGEDAAPSSWPDVSSARRDAPDLSPGARFGPYRIERVLGRGGMGVVYAAEHVAQGRRVALKVLSQGFAGPNERARFVREGQLAAAINHPNSVYIFGSDEVEGAPAIAMELLPGGTLKDRVQQDGPLPSTVAVDAILQVIAGLDAAHVAGVLHRDIKPSNCFVDHDGAVKVGDFGLSISTLARDGAWLADGFQGTPQYASPEQLRGEPLDLRSDLYAVGATLYFLLTGEPPFDHPHLVALVTRIVTEPAPSARTRQPSVPQDLARLVGQCLAKDREDRPASYAALTDALRPFSSAVSTPAPLGSRIAALTFDVTILTGATLLGVLGGLVQAWTVDEWHTYAWVVLAAALVYWTVTEGLWGTSYGTRACGLRVLTVAGRRVGVVRALGRALLFLLPVIVALLVYGALRRPVSSAWLWWASTSAVVATAGIAWSHGRRHDGVLGWHDLLSGTRVVVDASDTARATAAPRLAPPFAISRRESRVGPYDVIASIGPTDVGDILLAYDDRLKRHVWIHTTNAHVAAVPLLVRTMSRPGRLHWLGGQRTERQTWDAYEATDGRALVEELAGGPQPWSLIRQWLLDLARELHAGLQDGSVTTVSLDRVWVTQDGHAKWLEFCAPGSPSESVTPVPLSVESAQALLSRLAQTALGPASAPLPLSASTFLQGLSSGAFRTLTDVIAVLERLVSQPARVSRRQRGTSLALAVVTTVVGTLVLRKLLSPALPLSLDAHTSAIVSRYIGDLAYGLGAVVLAGVLCGGFWLRAFGIAVVTADGHEASRWRACGRAVWVWGWTPLQLVAVLHGWPLAVLVVWAVHLVGLSAAAEDPDRGLHDRLAGTYLVPR